MNAARRYQWEVLFWTLFAVAFVFVGAVPLENVLKQIPVKDSGPMNSTDAILGRSVQVKSERIAELVRLLPKDRPIAIVRPESDSVGLSASQVSVLCWPRSAPQLRVPPEGDPKLSEKLRALHPAAAFFLYTDIPADLPRGEWLSENLQFVPLP